LYFTGDDPTKLKEESQIVTYDGDSKDTTARAKAVIEALIKGPKNKSLQSSLPENTKLNSAKVSGGTATVDLSEEIKNATLINGEFLAAQAVVLTFNRAGMDK
jgi:spore germination protein GerM